MSEGKGKKKEINTQCSGSNKKLMEKKKEMILKISWVNDKTKNLPL